MQKSRCDDIKNRILFEDNHLIIINKNSGEIVQGDKTGDMPLVEKVKHYIKEAYHKPGEVFCGLVHRIDRPVSGVVIFAKTSKALTRMNELVKNRKVGKNYWAIVEKEPPFPEEKLVGFLKKNEKQNKSYHSSSPKEGYQQAELIYRLKGKSTHYTLLEVELITGRHHQIRAQLSAIGLHIKGDVKYGARRANENGSISLHARKVQFEHPVSHQIITVLAEPPEEEFRKIWDSGANSNKKL